MTIPANDATKQAFKAYLLQELATYSDSSSRLIPELKAKIESGDISAVRDAIEGLADALTSLATSLRFGQNNVFGSPKSARKEVYVEPGEDDEGPSYPKELMKTVGKYSGSNSEAAFKKYNGR